MFMVYVYRQAPSKIISIMKNILVLIAISLCSLSFVQEEVDGIQCYQCGPSTKEGAADDCGAYESFDTTAHLPVECNSDESHVPGSFCMKSTQQGPLGFIWDGRWRQVIRRCASVVESGVTGVCNWGVRWNGIYWQECYCSEDGCNSGHLATPNISVCLFGALLCLIYSLFWNTRH